jgi:hypothetical protein
MPRAWRYIGYHIKRNMTAASDAPLVSAVMTAVDNRTRFCCEPIHFAANILHPCMRGEDLNRADRVRGEDYIYDFARRWDLDEDLVEGELACYLAKTHRYDRERMWTGRSKFDPVTWWGANGSEAGKLTPLAEIAIPLAQYPASIAAVERGNKVGVGIIFCCYHYYFYYFYFYYYHYCYYCYYYYYYYCSYYYY